MTDRFEKDQSENKREGIARPSYDLPKRDVHLWATTLYPVYRAEGMNHTDAVLRALREATAIVDWFTDQSGQGETF